MDRAIVLERLGLADQDWGKAVTAATYAEFAAGWRGPAAVPSEAVMDAEWADFLGEGGLPALEESNQKTGAKALIDSLSPMDRAFVAGFDAARKGDNVLRAWLMDFKAVADAATTLAQFKAGIAGLANLPPLSKADVVTIIKGLIETP